MKVRLLALGAVLAFAGVACGDDADTGGNGTTTTPPPTGGGNTVSVTGLTFTPETLNVTAGSTVTWTWNGSIPHNVAADDGSFRSGDAANSGNFQHTFPAAGTFTYVCEVHKPGMKGTIVVA